MTRQQLDCDCTPGVTFTPEQASAIERREGSLLLDAGAGSGKTTVLVERFARSVVKDEIDVSRVLAITFTEKAAAELRERIRRRLRELGSERAARDAESAWISTIHGFCARVVRVDALRAGVDPEFAVLDPVDAAQLSAQAFDQALAAVAAEESGAQLIAAYGLGRLRGTIVSVHGELRSRGLEVPSLPACPAPPGDPADAIERVQAAAGAVLGELGAVQDPGTRINEAIAMLERIGPLLHDGLPWPAELEQLKLGRGAGALKSEACDRFREAVEDLRTIAGVQYSAATRDGLDELLRGYGERYAELKRRRSALDFEDLELHARALLRVPEIGGRYRERFGRVMVDEMQDTNRVQLELIDLVSDRNLFMVGDAQQSIYAFRHADVELFEQRGRELSERDARASLQTNFRSRSELLDVLNAAFHDQLGGSFRPLVPGRCDPPADDPAVELLVVDRHGDYGEDGVVAPWRLAEARVLAARVAGILADATAQARDVVVLTRATTDISAYEQALTALGVPTYVVGGRGYWSHPQVIALVAYLRALANPLDEEAWYTTLLSPLCGLSLDGVVLLGADAQDELAPVDRAVLDDFRRWFTGERAAAARTGAELMLERALQRHGYERQIASLPDARRRLANIRKLMRLAREWEAGHGSDLRGFVDLLAARIDGDGDREGEAPVESEDLDAVRLMTIHRSKGLEFPVVCVADLGRTSTAHGAPLVRVDREGRRLGLRIGRPGTAGMVETLAYEELKAEQAQAEAAEERRLFYVAMTRAKERLILSGAAHWTDWEAKNRRTPIGWIGPALVPNLGSRVSEGRFTSDGGVRVTLVEEFPDHEGGHGSGPGERRGDRHGEAGRSGEREVTGGAPEQFSGAPAAGTGGAGSVSAPPPVRLSYTALADYERCGYRFYARHVLRLPVSPLSAAVTPPPPPSPASAPAPQSPGALTGAALGTAVHEVLRDLDLRRLGTRALTSGLPPEVATLIERFAGSDTARRLMDVTLLRREQPFAFLLGEMLITGTFDVLARERTPAGTPEQLLVVDYKSDRVDTDPVLLAHERYGTQRMIYALAALRTGAERVEVVHLFLQDPDRPVGVIHSSAELPALQDALAAEVAGMGAGDYPVTDEPGWDTCAECPAAGGLCPYPLERIMRR